MQKRASKLSNTLALISGFAVTAVMVAAIAAI